MAPCGESPEGRPMRAERAIECVRIFDAIISDGQLDECGLTLRELTQIREAIISSLTAIYHTRIDYPGFNVPPLIASLPASDAHAQEPRGVTYERAADVPINKAGEVEDEAIARGTSTPNTNGANKT